MPTISSAEVVTSLTGTTAEAVVTWHTDELCDATVTWFQAGVAKGRLNDPNFSMDHSLTIPDLLPGADYSVLLASSTERGMDCGCDPVMPGTDCSLDFSTPKASGPADDISVSLSSGSTVPGQPVTLTIEAASNGSPVGQREVRFRIHNGADRGSFSSNPAATGPNGSVQVSYNPVKRGKSQIQVLVDTVSTGVDVMVN